MKRFSMPDALHLLPGNPIPLGATPSTRGTNFAVYSAAAHAVDLCLFDAAEPERELVRVRLSRCEGDVWCAFVGGVKPGALYGFRAHGAAALMNASKLLVDPYAKAIAGIPDGRADMHSYAGREAFPGFLDNGATMLKGVVIDDRYDWCDDMPPAVPWSDTVIYELHVRGFTKLHPLVPAELRGTYAGLCEPAAIDYLRALGVTAVQLLPVHQHLDDGWLVEKGLTNYWGYNTLGFLAPHAEYAAASDGQGVVDEFKTMVRTLHSAGMEVIIDVVFNHTAEGGENGPLLSLRGLDDEAYYARDTAGNIYDCTGCGNTVAAWQPAALRLIMDSLRYWVQEMHVDGFRFDLATTVGRGPRGFDVRGAFFAALAQDPVLASVKLIAEPWDVGQMDSYQVGHFPRPWRELNGKYRDAIRRFWRGDSGMVPEFAKRLCGSEDLYGRKQRGPLASVNFLTSHDGYTMADLVSYERKNNQANGEDNRDGDNDNHSANYGCEGPSDEIAILEMRERVRRSLMATMLFSAGVPFITMGDERGRSQLGNNNAYCQDNILSWMDWSETGESVRFASFVAELAALRRARSELRRVNFFDGKVSAETGVKDVLWLTETGQEMKRDQWHERHRSAFGAVIDGRLCLLFNNGHEACDMALPEGAWAMVLDTGGNDLPNAEVKGEDAVRYRVESRAMVLLAA